MNNNSLLISLFSLLLLLSCDEQETPLFSAGHEIYFEKFFVNAMPPGTEAADSTIASFFFYPDATLDIKVPLVVHLSGSLPLSDLKFGLKAIPEETTAFPEEYTLADSYTFRAQEPAEDATDVTDTIFVVFHRGNRSEELAKGIKLTVELQPSEDLQLGQVERIRAKLIMTTATVQPAWWDSEVTENLLGTYSEKKYKYFLNEIDRKAEMNAMLIRSNPDRAIQLTLQFKAWLAKQNPRIEENDGSLMEVKI